MLHICDITKAYCLFKKGNEPFYMTCPNLLLSLEIALLVKQIHEVYNVYSERVFYWHRNSRAKRFITDLEILSVQDMVMSRCPSRTPSHVCTGPAHFTGSVPSPDSIFVRRWLWNFFTKCLLLCTRMTYKYNKYYRWPLMTLVCSWLIRCTVSVYDLFFSFC